MRSVCHLYYNNHVINYVFRSKWPTYKFINFPEIIPPILLFSPIRLLVFQKSSHLYFYSEPSSIQNSRVHQILTLLTCQTIAWAVRNSDFQCRERFIRKLFFLKSQKSINLGKLQFQIMPNFWRLGAMSIRMSKHQIEQSI